MVNRLFPNVETIDGSNSNLTDLNDALEIIEEDKSIDRLDQDLHMAINSLADMPMVE